MYKCLPIDFYENLKTQRNAKKSDEVIPFHFSEKTLKGESKIKVSLPKKKKCVD